MNLDQWLDCIKIELRKQNPMEKSNTDEFQTTITRGSYDLPVDVTLEIYIGSNDKDGDDPSEVNILSCNYSESAYNLGIEEDHNFTRGQPIDPPLTLIEQEIIAYNYCILNDVKL